MNKKGISLIVLVITIIVTIILAASVVITLSNTGIIDKANNAVNTTNVKEVEQLAQLLWAEAYMEGKTKAADIQAYIDSKLDQEIKDMYDIVATEKGVTVTLPIDPTSITIGAASVGVGRTLDLNEKVTYLPEYSKRKSLTWEITEGSSYASITEAGVITGVAEGNVTVKATITGTSISNTATVTVTPAPVEVTASDIKTNASTYYGTTVEYDSKVAGTTWQILYVGNEFNKTGDTNDYIYLIAADYVKNTDLPTKNGATPVATEGSEYKAAFATSSTDGVFATAAGYTGSASITDAEMIALNSKYYDYLTDNSTNNNMKAVAYMLDKDIWTPKFGGSKTKYVIGGPTIELLYAAYKAKTGTENTCSVSSLNGYTWSGNVSGSPFVAPSTNASYYWVASPSTHNASNVVLVYNLGNVYNSTYLNTISAFRPVVCLESGVQLEKVGDILKIK